MKGKIKGDYILPSVGRNEQPKPKNKKSIKRLPKYLKDEEVKNLLDRCEGRRDRLIIELILLTGLRVSEVLGITPDDIDFRNRTIQIHGKGSRDRTVYPPRDLLYDLP